MTITDALDDLEERIDAVEAALDAGEVPELPDFTPGRLEGEATPEERRRFLSVMQRLQDCQTRLRRHRSRMLEEYAGLDTRRRAATAYAGEH